MMTPVLCRGQALTDLAVRGLGVREQTKFGQVESLFKSPNQCSMDTVHQGRGTLGLFPQVPSKIAMNNFR